MPAHLSTPPYHQRILCVDAAAESLRVLMVFFAHEGCTVEGISDFAEALALIAAEPASFDLVVVGCADVAGDGARVAAELRAAGHRGEIALRVSERRARSARHPNVTWSEHAQARCRAAT